MKYNPFKMWGSWLGAFLAPGIVSFFANSDQTILYRLNLIVFWINETSLKDIMNGVLFIMIMGFLIGYVLQRKFGKRR